MKSLSSVLSILLLVTTIHAQEPNKISNDSIKQLYQQKIKTEQQQLRKTQAVARVEFLAKLDSLNPDSVTELKINKMGLIHLPDLTRFHRLKKIDASGNNIKHFNRRFFKSDSLKTVILSDNPIKRVCFPASSKIENVVINQCHLKRLPRSIRKLKELKTLECTYNNIKHIPPYIKRFKNLNEANFNFNRIKFNGRVPIRLANVERVLLAGNNLSTLPENIGYMTGAKKLNLADNCLSLLPASFGKMDSLQTVIFYKNNFTTIPEVIFKLNGLIELDFYYNNISNISEKIGNLSNLKRIYLSFNKLGSLPKSMKHLSRLKFLYIHHNQLKILSGWLTSLPNLTILDAGFNQLISIPDLSLIKPLEEVDIQHNNLEDIPWKLIAKPELKRLYLRDNPFIEDEDKTILKKQIQQKASRQATIYFY